MHRIIMGDGSVKSAMNPLHMRNTKLSRYLNTYTAVPQQRRFSEVSYRGH